MAEARDLPRNRKRTPGAKDAASGPPEPIRQPPRLSLRDGYSLFVGTMKVVLPALAIALILMVIVWPRIVSQDSTFRIGVSDLTPEEVDNLRMVNPRYQGRDEEGRPFTVIAETATQESSGANKVALVQPQADITLNAGTWISVTARDGTYQRDSEMLNLKGEVNLFHDQGFEMHTDEADVDLKTGKASSDTPVQGQGPAGTLTAQGFRLLDKGERIIFTGKSHMTIYESELEGAQ